MGVATAIIGSALIGGVASMSASKNARKAQDSQNNANRSIADEANRMEMERFYQSRGASAYDLENGLIDDKRSAILPYYLSGLENNLATGIEGKYGALQEAYNPNEMATEMGGYRDSLAGAEQGAVGAIRGIYDGSQLSESQRYLQGITNQRLQGQDQIDLARQGIGNARLGVGDARGLVGDAREQMINARDGIADARNAGLQSQATAMTLEAQRQAGNNNTRNGVRTGLGGAQSLQALMNAYVGMAGNRANVDVLNQRDQVLNEQDRVQTAQEGVLTAKDAITTAGEGLQGVRERSRINELDEAAKFAAYEQNLAEQKNIGQINNTLNTLAANQTAGVQNYFLPENATSSALNKGGFQLGQGRAPEYNVPSYTAPTPNNPMAHLNAGVQSGLGGYMLAKGLGAGGGGGSTPTGYGTVLAPPSGGYSAAPDMFSGTWAGNTFG